MARGARTPFVVVGLCSLLLAGLAAPAADADDCPNAAVRAQQGATALPDCRAYEIVNPPSLDIGDVMRTFGISENGERTAWVTFFPADDALGAQGTANAVAFRGPSSWLSVDANLALTGNFGGYARANLVAHSADFSRLLAMATVGFDPDDLDGEYGDLYRLQVGTGNGTWLSHGENLPDAEKGLIGWMGGTPDLERNVFQATQVQLLSNPPLTAGIYARDADGLELVSVLPGGGAAAAPSAAVPVDVYGGALPPPHGGPHAVSDDATRVFFYDRHSLYLRDTRAQTTTAISASQRAGDVGSVHGAQFIAASHDGDVAFFASIDQLTDSAPPGGGIYRFELSTGALTLIAPAGNPNGIELGPALASDDSSHLYFSSPRGLAPGGQEGGLNIYVWSAGAGTRLVAAAAPPGPVGWPALARVARSGRYALIESVTPIAGASNAGHKGLFEYDDATGEVACVSCRPDGSPSEGEATTQSTPALGVTGYLAPRNLTDDGRVYFSSTDRIVAADHSTAADVYEYDSGTVSLLTAGRGDDDSYLSDNTDDGSDVFVLTRSPFVAEDRDPGELDLYDLRVGGGFLRQEDPLQLPCDGDECQGPRVAAPGIPWIGSMEAGDIQRSGLRVAASKTVAGMSARLTVKVSAAGRLVLRGEGLKTFSRGAPSAGAYRLTATLTAGAKHRYVRNGSLKTTATVLFRARGGDARYSTPVRLTFGPSAKGGGGQ